MNNNTNTEQKKQENKCLKIRFSQAEIEGLDPRVKALTGYFERLPKVEELQELLGVGRAAAFKLLKPLKAIELPIPRRTDGKKESYYQIDKKAFKLNLQTFILCNYLSQLNSRNGYKEFHIAAAVIKKNTGIIDTCLSRQMKLLRNEGFFNYKTAKKGQYLISFKPVIIRPIDISKSIDNYLNSLTDTLNNYANYWTKQANIMRINSPDYEQRIQAIAQNLPAGNCLKVTQPKAGQSLKEMDLAIDEQPKTKEQPKEQEPSLIDNPFSKLCRTKEEKAIDEQKEQFVIIEQCQKNRAEFEKREAERAAAPAPTPEDFQAAFKTLGYI